MPISVKCPECDAPYKVPDEAAGKAIKCKKCGAKVSIPSAEADEGGDDFAGVGAGAANGGGESKEKKKSSTGKILTIVGAVLAVSCCVCGGGGGTLGYFYVYVPTRDAAKKVVADVKKAQEEFDKNFGKDFNKNFGKDMGKGVVASGPTILEKKETLTDKDPKVANGKPAKTYKVKLEMGKEYIIDMKATTPGFGQDPYLFLLDPGNKQVAFDDDGGGNLDAQIRYTPTVTGEFTVQATCLGGVLGGGLPFSLTVKLK
jgi:predicted Zn finger-like uncharacterized protein